MNYFEFYDIPVSFKPDKDLVKRKFYALSKEYHPDFYVNEAQEKQKEILELSTLNNKAYQTLSNGNKLVAYILELSGELVEGDRYELPPVFLMEVMELNEALMELEFDFDADKLQEIKSNAEEIGERLAKEQEQLMLDYDVVAEEEKSAVIKKIKDIYYRSKYLLRIKDAIHTFASR